MPLPSPAAPDTLVRHIAELDFDQLLDLKVTLGSRTPEKWYRSASAMYVITSEDIRRSGLTLVPELLRMAPGVQVARLDANKWKITIRGFNERFSSKLLVLVDGRIVYTQLFSGVYWDVQDLPIEDIDRIEIVRGPGGALWGSNAVNGIINIVTRNAADTRGGLVVATAGDEATRAQLTGRYGFGGDNLDVRVYGRYLDQDAGGNPQDGYPDTGGSYTPGAEAGDGWQQWHAGFRGDWRANDRDKVSFFGDLYQGEFGQTRVLTLPTPTTLPDTVEASGGYVGLHWQRTLSAGSDLGLRLYYDHTFREDEGLWEKRDTYTADFQHRVTLGRHELLWGGEYRASADETRRRSTVYFDPASRNLRRGTVFVQDRIALDAAHAWSVTIGSKFEVNNITDFEVQPSLRLLWAPSDRTSAWTAVSRAVRTPSRANSDLYLEPAPGVMIPLGNPDLGFGTGHGLGGGRALHVHRPLLRRRRVVPERLRRPDHGRRQFRRGRFRRLGAGLPLRGHADLGPGRHLVIHRFPAAGAPRRRRAGAPPHGRPALQPGSSPGPGPGRSLLLHRSQCGHRAGRRPPGPAPGLAPEPALRTQPFGPVPAGRGHHRGTRRNKVVLRRPAQLPRHGAGRVLGMAAGRHDCGRVAALVGGAVFVLALLWCSAVPVAAAEGGAAGADASPSLVQAGFITKFPLFVYWPQEAWVPGEGPLAIGVIGDSPVLADLQQLARYTEIDGSALEIRHLEEPGDAAGCQIIFIAAGEDRRLEAILEAVRGQPVLTVADSPGFAGRGVHINFYVENERIRFELNQQACEEAGLGLSFRLRNVARLVE